MKHKYKKTILITGCSSGIGYSAAHGLRKIGWRVFATCRKLKDCDRLKTEGFESFQLDYSNPETITSSAKKIDVLSNGRLDALFNNGAYALPGAVEDLSRDALRAIFEVNFFGQVELINTLLPALRESDDGRVVNCSSVLGFVALPYRGAYNATKFALKGITDTLRREETGKKIKFILLEPGPIKTELRAKSIKYFEEWIDWQNSTLLKIYQRKILKRLYNANDSTDRFQLDSKFVTKKLIHALTSKNPRERYYVTYPTYVADFLSRFLSTRLQDSILR